MNKHITKKIFSLLDYCKDCNIYCLSSDKQHYYCRHCGCCVSFCLKGKIKNFYCMNQKIDLFGIGYILLVISIFNYNFYNKEPRAIFSNFLLFIVSIVIILTTTSIGTILFLKNGKRYIDNYH